MVKNQVKKGICVLSAFIGFFFAFFSKTEADLFKAGNIIWDGKYILVLIFICLSGAMAGAGVYILGLFITTNRKPQSGTKKNIPALTAFAGSFCISIVSYLPFLFAFYPGICAYDLPVQLAQITQPAFNDHHPLWHTLFIKLCLMVAGDKPNAGLAVYTIFQIVLLSLSIAFLIFVLNKCGCSLAIQIVTQVLFSLVFVHGYMAVSITKDTIFTAFFIAFTGAIYLYLNEVNVKKALINPVMITGAVGVCLFRNNGKYALLALIVVAVIATLLDRKKRKSMVLFTVNLLVGFVIATCLSKVAFAFTNAEHGDKREMLSVPLQQLARVMVYEEEELSLEEKALIDELILYRAYENYNPVISDPVKGLTNTSVVRYQTGRFLKVYLGLLKKYPGDYINATLALIGGYVSPFDETYRLYVKDGDVITRNYIQHTFTATEFPEIAYETTLAPGLKRFFDDFAEYDWFTLPVLNLFYIPGFYLWFLLIAITVTLQKEHYRNLIPLLFIMAFFGTLLLGPTMHLRYIYPIIAALPLIAAGRAHES